MAGRAPQAHWCSDACKQAAYRMRREGKPDREDNAPSARYQAPAVASTERTADGWRVTFDDGVALDVDGWSDAQARARARWLRARRV